MKFTLLVAAAALTASAASAQTALPDTPILAGATPAPDCGNLYGLAGKAVCVSAPLAGIGALADAYVADLEGRGWIAAGGDDNRVVFVRRREGGGCDGLQMQAFYDTSKPAGPDATGYLGFGVIPGDVCAAGQPGAAAAPQQ
ncbi:hypothetical protein [Brevundimonas sp.]|uniref:hypothetical protein n=1 Tax=Brevundimonas sp. TaxID=1871086 RepID=UPI002EDB4AE0